MSPTGIQPPPGAERWRYQGVESTCRRCGAVWTDWIDVVDQCVALGDLDRTEDGALLAECSDCLTGASS